MAELNRRPGSPGDDPTPAPDGNRGGESDRHTRPDAGPAGDQSGGRTGERSRVRGASPPVPHKAPSRWDTPHQPAPNDGSGARPNESPASDTGAGRPRARSRVRPAPRDDRTTTDTSPGAAPTAARSTEITGLQSRAATDRRDLARHQADERTDHDTADASGPGAPDDPSPPAPQANVDERADGIDRERPEDLARRRAVELQDQLPDGARGRVTMAVGVTEAAAGEQTTVIGTSEPRGYLRPGVTLNEGEVVAAGHGHAEADIVHWAEQREQKVLTVGAGRPICAPCAEEIQRVDAVAATPLKEEK